MRLRLRFLLPVLALVLVVPTTARAADKPNEQALYQDGPDGRYLLDGDWLFRGDNPDQGIKQRFMRQTSTSGWTKVKVPHVWNLGDASNESMSGGIGWYRKDFELPSADSALAWAFRFESVNYRARVWLNGKPIGENTGAYVPLELSPSGFKRRGDEPARGAGGLRAAHHRLPARRPEHRRRPDRRLVELRRHPARGLSAQARHGRLPAGRRPPGAAVRQLRRDDPGADQPQERHPSRPAGHGHRQVRPPEPAAGDEDDRARRDHRVRRQPARAQSAAVVAGEPEPLRRQLHRPRRRRQGRGLLAQERHPLDQGLQRPAGPQRATAQHARARPARGLQGPRLRDRQQAPRGARRPGQGAGGDDRCARTIRCTPTRTSWPTARAC